MGELPVVQGEDGLRRFEDPILQTAVENALAHLPEGKHVATVAHASLTGVSLSVVARIDKGWSVCASAFKPWHGQMVAEAEVVWSW
jgi:hypothetical protein